MTTEARPVHLGDDGRELREEIDLTAEEDDALERAWERGEDGDDSDLDELLDDEIGRED
jgi:hypothetical protein